VNSTDEWERFAAALARAMGAVHAAVGLTLVAPGRVPVVAAIVVGLGVFFLSGRARDLTPKQVAALGYAGPVGAVLLIRIGLANPSDGDATQYEVLSFFWAVCEATPVQAYLMAVAFGLARAGGEAVRNPFDPPGR